MKLILALLAGIATFAFAPQHAAADDYPNRTVRIIEPYSAGGAPDVLLRLVAQKLTEKWKQPVVVENRPGGNTLIGTTAVTKSDPDGYTLLLTADQTFILNPLLYAKLPYSMKELDPIVLMASIPHMLAVANKVPVSNVKELIALAKSKPDTLMYGSTGPASIQRLAAEYFAGIAGIKLVHVPYKGAPETTTAVLTGEIDMTINGMSNILPHIKSKGLKALAISTEKRSPLTPDIPTMQEAGVPGYVSKGAFGLLAPAGTPPAIKQKIAKDVSEILMQPDVVAALGKLSFVVDNFGPADFEKMIATETTKWGEVVKRLNIKIE
ncbi:MAG: tripartite tricarboxylate transporter substrate binding protein [Rhizobiales bacterium]|nr:tripartite tricarboxylate transporter substrate binding protein [Hyphomicrobiales bacterium]